MAPPKIPIDMEQVRKLAAIDCTNAEIAAVLKISIGTLERRCRQAIAEGKEEGKASIRRKQFEIAQKGNVAMLIWLGKQRLGQTDKQDTQLQHSGEQVIRVIREQRSLLGNDRIALTVAHRNGDG